MIKKISSLTAIIATLFAILLNAEAADPMAEIKLLRQQLDALRQGSIQSNSNAAQAIAEMQDIKTEIQSIKGSLESNAHMIKTSADKTDLRLRDMEARIGGLEERLQIQGKQVTSAVSAVAPEAAAEAELYQAALNQVNNSEFIKAIATLKKFLEKFPNSSYASNAQYWIAECYFAMRDFEMAIKSFQTVQEKYPRSDKVPAAMLKQGYSFIELNMETDAKVFLNNLIKKHPQSKEAREAKDRLARMEHLRKEEMSKPTPVSGDIPLAPGVVVPGEKNKPETNPTGKYQ